jgi:hypothetical protein
LNNIDCSTKQASDNLPPRLPSKSVTTYTDTDYVTLGRIRERHIKINLICTFISYSGLTKFTQPLREMSTGNILKNVGMFKTQRTKWTDHLARVGDKGVRQ